MRSFLFLVVSLPSFAVLAACTAIWVTSRPPGTVMRRTSFHRSASASSRRSPAPTMASQHVSSGRQRRRSMASSIVGTSHTSFMFSIAAKGSASSSMPVKSLLPTSPGSSNFALAHGLTESLPSLTAWLSTAESAFLRSLAMERVFALRSTACMSAWVMSVMSLSPSSGIQVFFISVV